MDPSLVPARLMAPEGPADYYYYDYCYYYYYCYCCYCCFHNPA